MSLTFIDLFSGIGGFRLGMERAGHTCLGHCEINKWANVAYRAIHEPKEGEWFNDDISRVRADELPRANVWCFGFPCQDISSAGRQAGFGGKRSSLFFKVTALIRELAEENKPEYLFIENVKNLLSINRGIDFGRLLVELDDIGYDVEWQLLNSKNFGVPQKRQRVFIIGHLRTRGTRKVFPIEGENGSVIKRIQIDVSGKGHRSEQDRLYYTDGIMGCLPASRTDTKVNIIVDDLYKGRKMRFHKNVSPTIRAGRNGLKILRLERDTGLPIPDFIPSAKGITKTLRSHGFNTLTAKHCFDHVAIPVLSPDRINKRQNGRRFKTNGEPSFTLTAQDRHGVAIREATKTGYAIAEDGDGVDINYPNSKTRRGRVIKKLSHTITAKGEHAVMHGYRIRKLTERECWRLQGFPDWAFDRAKAAGVPNSQLYAQAGNAVTVTVIQAIAERMGINEKSND